MSEGSPTASALEPELKAGSAPEPDPFGLSARFVDSHRRYFAQALAELEAGHKRSCWSWYLLPTAPWVVNGRERGSGMNQEYALRDLPPNTHRGEAAARAFLRFRAAARRAEGEGEGEGEGGGEGEGEVSLRDNYVAILSAIAKQLEAGVTPRAPLGCDCTRLRASVELFERASAGGFDSECHELCTRILEKVQ